jgi:hypothetical protein
MIAPTWEIAKRRILAGHKATLCIKGENVAEAVAILDKLPPRLRALLTIKPV